MTVHAHLIHFNALLPSDDFWRGSTERDLVELHQLDPSFPAPILCLYAAGGLKVVEPLFDRRGVTKWMVEQKSLDVRANARAILLAKREEQSHGTRSG